MPFIAQMLENNIVKSVRFLKFFFLIYYPETSLTPMIW